MAPVYPGGCRHPSIISRFRLSEQTKMGKRSWRMSVQQRMNLAFVLAGCQCSIIPTTPTTQIVQHPFSVKYIFFRWTIPPETFGLGAYNGYQIGWTASSHFSWTNSKIILTAGTIHLNFSLQIKSAFFPWEVNIIRDLKRHKAHCYWKLVPDFLVTYAKIQFCCSNDGGHKQSYKFRFCLKPGCGKIQFCISSRAIPLFMLYTLASSWALPPAFRDNGEGDRRRREIYCKNWWCSPYNGVPTRIPLKKEACGNWMLLGSRSPWGYAFFWALCPEQFREKCLGYWSASNAEPSLGWDGWAALGCLIFTWSQDFAVHVIIQLPFPASSTSLGCLLCPLELTNWPTGPMSRMFVQGWLHGPLHQGLLCIASKMQEVNKENCHEKASNTAGSTLSKAQHYLAERNWNQCPFMRQLSKWEFS